MGLAHGLSSGDWLGGLVCEPDERAILMDALWVECAGFDMLSGNVD